ncbi:hypothetical protein [Brevibacillus sp. MER 51]|nr:hypothetical protein [Brevibacillus sp. MER 51]
MKQKELSKKAEKDDSKNATGNRGEQEIKGPFPSAFIILHFMFFVIG